LVLNRGDGALGHPIHIGGGGLREDLDVGLVLLLRGVKAGHGALELGVGHVSELVDAHGITKLLGFVLVVVVDEVEVVLEDAEAHEDL